MLREGVFFPSVGYLVQDCLVMGTHLIDCYRPVSEGCRREQHDLRTPDIAQSAVGTRNARIIGLPNGLYTIELTDVVERKV
jgi:hypothetical protein